MSVSTESDTKPVYHQLKIVMLFLTIYFVVGLVPLYLLFSLAVDALQDEVSDRLTLAATIGSQHIDGDAHARIRSAEDITSADYLAVREQMRRMVTRGEHPSIVHVYSLRKKESANNEREGTYFVVDSAEVGDFPFLSAEDIAAFGSPYCLGPGMIEAFKGNTSTTGFLYESGCGTWRTGYAPIRTGDGTIDAILCVDGSATGTLASMQKMYSWTRFSLVSSMVFLFILSIIIGIRNRTSQKHPL